MPRLTDDELRAMREIMARRRGRAQPVDHPVKAEVMANRLRYEIKQVQPQRGLVTIAASEDLAEMRARLAELGRSARAMIYVVGRMPSRGPNAEGAWPVDEDEIYS